MWRKKTIVIKRPDISLKFRGKNYETLNPGAYPTAFDFTTGYNVTVVVGYSVFTSEKKKLI
jgi:hypothetical protein